MANGTMVDGEIRMEISTHSTRVTGVDNAATAPECSISGPLQAAALGRKGIFLHMTC